MHAVKFSCTQRWVPIQHSKALNQLAGTVVVDKYRNNKTKNKKWALIVRETLYLLHCSPQPSKCCLAVWIFEAPKDCVRFYDPRQEWTLDVYDSGKKSQWRNFISHQTLSGRVQYLYNFTPTRGQPIFFIQSVECFCCELKNEPDGLIPKKFTHFS